MYQIAVLPGDGIGPEIISQTVKVLQKADSLYSIGLSFSTHPFGGEAIDQTGGPLPESTLHACQKADAVLLGAVGGPKWDGLTGAKRPEAGLLALRKSLGLYANLRPATVYPALRACSPLKSEIIGDGIDLLIVRELTGGIYFGQRGRGNGCAFDTESYTQEEIERIAVQAFELARKRDKTLCSVDKANVLESSRLWRETVEQVALRYPDVSLRHLYVDNAAMQLVCNPRQFSTLVTSNLFGDILSDEASMITGSIGMLPSASLGDGPGLYEPIHGSAPDIAGQDIANPLAAILAGGMMLRLSFSLEKEADAIQRAVVKALDSGFRTQDLSSPGTTLLSCSEMGDKVASFLEKVE